MTLTLPNGMILTGTIDEIIEYIQKTQATYIDSSRGNYNINYSKVDSKTFKSYSQEEIDDLAKKGKAIFI